MWHSSEREAATTKSDEFLELLQKGGTIKIAKFSSYCSLIFGHEDGEGLFAVTAKSIRFVRCWLSFKSERVSPLRELTRINGSLMQSPLQQSDLESAIYCNLLRAMTRTTEIFAQCKSLQNFSCTKPLFNFCLQ